MRDRVIVVFPDLPDPAPIHALRQRFDPLANLIPPHLTLVFPYQSELSGTELERHVRNALAGVGGFPLRLQGVTGSEDEYLFLNVKRGNDELIRLHDQLYTGPLERFLRPDLTFTPHLTIGRLPSPTEFKMALKAAAVLTQSFETQVTHVSVYTIHADGHREIELNVPLSA